MISISSLIPTRRKLLRSELDPARAAARACDCARARALSFFGIDLTPYDVMHVYYTCSFSLSGGVLFFLVFFFFHSLFHLHFSSLVIWGYYPPPFFFFRIRGQLGS